MPSKLSALDMPDVVMGQLPENLQLQRTRVVCKADAPIHTEGIQYSGAYASLGVDNSAGLDSFCKNFKVEVVKLSDDDIEFDMIGIEAPLANAFRRILIAEVPTMAIEKVLVANNTSVVADEVLAHRLGLIPLNADPRQFEYLSENDIPNERNTIMFKLDVQCKKGSPRVTVKSGQLKWLPKGSELLKVSNDNSAKAKSSSFDEKEVTGDNSAKAKGSTSSSSLHGFEDKVEGKPLGVKYEDIIIAKLGPSQEIELEAHAVKGIGKVHAKWSPVATAWFRMLPEVVLLKEVKNADAEKLVKKCPVHVFDIEDLGRGGRKAVVANPRACTLCRECIRGATEDFVELRRVKHDLIFRIESTGALPPEELFLEAVKILEDKCDRILSELS